MVSPPTQPPTAQVPWTPTAHAFAQHQFSQVTNFWKQGRQATFRLEALPGGQAELNLTFQLPSASEVIPPPFHVPTVPAPQRPILPLFPKSCFPQGFGPDSKAKLASQKKLSQKQRKSYRRSVLHRATLAAPSLPPPKQGSLRHAALACVQRQHVDISSIRKRAPPCSPSKQSPLAQRMRSDFQIGDSENESPEKELLRSHLSPKNFPSPTISPPNVKGFPPPAPLALTPLTLKTNDEVEIVRSDFLESIKAVEKAEPVKVVQSVEIFNVEENDKVAEEDSDWETIEDSENHCEYDFPAINLDCEDWAEKYTKSIQRFHNNYIVKCENCDGVFTPEHQC